MNQKHIIVFLLIKALLVNGLIANDGEFENKENNIKFVDHNKNLDISPHLEENQGKPVKFTKDITKIDNENFFKDPNTKTTKNNIEHDNNLVVFEDIKHLQSIGDDNFVKKPRRHRNRRPKKQFVNGNYGLVNQGIYEGQNTFGVDRPKRRKRLLRKPSLTEQASSTFINALTSISLYDDQQCIPKLLCDTTAGRKGGFTGSSMLQGFLDLQPLMTLLLAYNGATASPLFSFGRAIIIGMSSSQQNPYICRKSYPLCPSDPEKLVHYLNNHNGGFFRFFNNINNNQQQSLNQFLGHLTNAPPGYDQNLYAPQNIGLEQNLNQLGQQNHHHLNNQPNFNRYSPLQNQNGYVLQSQNHVNNKYLNNYKSLRRDLENEYTYSNKSKESRNDLELTESGNAEKNYETTQDSVNENSIKISRRILTKSDDDDEEKDDDHKPIEAFEDIPKWLLPHDDDKSKKQLHNHNRKIKTLLFPDELNKLTTNNYLDKHQGTIEYRPPLNSNNESKKGFIFPDYNTFKNYDHYTNFFETNKYDKIENKINVKYENINVNNVKDDDFEIVYIVRGNGDPNHPEIVRRKPGKLL